MAGSSQGVAGVEGRTLTDVVLVNPPPYKSLPWLGMGLPLIAAWLEPHGIGAKIIRLLDAPFSTPEDVANASFSLMCDDPPIADRLSAFALLWERHSEFFESLLARLVA